MLVYLDTCCLNRPYDDQTQARIQLETAAVLSIMEHVHQGRIDLADSSVLKFEIGKIADLTRKDGILNFLKHATTYQVLTSTIENRGIHLHQLGFKRLDALHVAAAEVMNADFMLTTDDQLLARATQHSSILAVSVLNPVQFPTF